MPTDYSGMTHEELGERADPLSRIINRDTAILGYMPTDEEVEAAKIEYAALNAASRVLNEVSPQVFGAAGPEVGRLAADEVKWIIDKRMTEARARASQNGTAE
jgi:hypothetical protein